MISSNEFLQLIYDRFRTTGTWPLVRDLQITLRQKGNIRQIASTVGFDKVICEDRADGVCFLRLEGISACRNSETDVKNFLAAVRLASSHYISSGPGEITSQMIQTQLSLSDLETRRLSEIMYRHNAPWSSAGWSQDRSWFHFEPGTEIVFFENVHTLTEYLDTKDRIAAEAAEATRLAWSSLGRADQVPRWELGEDGSDAQPLALQVTIHDPKLRQLLEHDLAELQRVLSAEAWKAAGILAGSCLETILLDLWKRQEDAAKDRFGAAWPDRVSAYDLAAAAAEAGLLSQDQKDLASTMRRWRNLVHPAAALRGPQPGRQLAEALVALLKLLLVEIQRDDDPLGDRMER